MRLPTITLQIEELSSNFPLMPMAAGWVCPSQVAMSTEAVSFQT